MKNKAQLISSIMFILTFIKGLIKQLNIVDIVFLICTTIIFLVYEFINNSKLEKEILRIEKDTNKKLEDVSKSLEEAKSYMSKMAATSAFNRR